MIKKGFTLVEVAIFLALTGVLITVVIAGTTRNMAEKRYNDTVSDFESFLEVIYTGVQYVEYDGNGDNSRAVYGKLVEMTSETTFTSYNILGDARINGRAADALEQLLKQNPILMEDSGGLVSKTYSPNWGGKIRIDDTGTTIFLLVVRHPKTGTVSTYVSKTATLNTSDLRDSIENGGFIAQDANFCIDSDDRWAAGNERRLIRIHAGASNSSGIETIANQNKEILSQKLMK